MKIEKLPSGSYRIRKMYKGTTYTIITDYKPTQKEALQLLTEEMNKISVENKPLTFKEAVIKYIEVKENVLSPSTVKSYYGILRNLSDNFKSKRLSDISGIDVQKEINDYSLTRSPKTVSCAHGLISSTLKMFCPNVIINTTLPQKIKKEEYIPSDEDIKKILNYAKGSKYETALLLATFGLRRSEICAIKKQDVNGNTLTINKSKVINSNNEYVIKTTKTTEGTRKIFIPDYLADLIKKNGCAFNGNPNMILKYLHQAQNKLNIPKFRLHAMRHYYASMAHALGIPDSYIMASGGWKTDNVLKSVYRHAMDDKKGEMQKFAAQYISEMLSN